MNVLLQFRAVPNIPCRQGISPLELCIQKGQSRLIHRLIEAGADTTFPTQGGDTFLHKAATLQSPEIICMLRPSYTAIKHSC